MTHLVTWSEVVDRYPAVDSRGGAKEITDTYIVYAENELNGMLGTTYATPFAATNLTAKDLVIELVYLRIGVLKLKDKKMMHDMLMKKIKMLKSGESQMMDSSGTPILSTGPGIYSSDEGVHHTFGVGETEDMIVDHDKLETERSEREY